MSIVTRAYSCSENTTHPLCVHLVMFALLIILTPEYVRKLSDES